jgi:hypothetical protein
VPFFGVGLFLLVHLLADGMFEGLAVVIPCILIGFVALVARAVLEVDEDKRRVAFRIGIGLPMIAWWSHDLSACRSLWIRFQESSESESTAYVLGASVGDTDREIFNSIDLLEVRALAEKLSKVSGLGITDEATASGYREAGSLDEPLRQRLLRQGAPPIEPTPPRLMVDRIAGELRVMLPRAPFWPQFSLAIPAVLFLILLLLIPLARVFALHESFRNEPNLLLVIDSLCALDLIAVAFVVRRFGREIRGIETETALIASSEGVKVHYCNPLGRHVEALSSNVIESIGMGYRRQVTHFADQGPKRLLVIADHAVLSFGAGCTDVELRWLAQAISEALVSPQTS